MILTTKNSSVFLDKSANTIKQGALFTLSTYLGHRNNWSGWSLGSLKVKDQIVKVSECTTVAHSGHNDAHHILEEAYLGSLL